MNIKKITFVLTFFLIIFSSSLFAQTDPSAVDQPALVTKLAILAGLSLLPFAVMILTSFVKIIIVLSLFRSALGVQQTPPNQVLTGLALLLTIFVMFPTGVLMYNSSKEVIDRASTA
ncbi:MAG: Flagellar biosynthetic protein FliP, partial [Candidatus Anoxychlamydiales bacterium]|nr:Flagellar biosynthetic protein FliP [Candidatus Anoxychlamydiales bacterium]